jgi:type IV pilus assembly protein PilE
MEQKMKNRARGFTLIELLIVVVIVAVFAMIAYPSYSKYMQRTRRAQAKADLAEYAGQLEREFTVNRSFSAYTLPFTTSPRDSGAVVAYNLAAAIPTSSTYVLTAAPAAGPQASDLCGTLTLNQAGLRQHSAGDNSTCNWGTVGP